MADLPSQGGLSDVEDFRRTAEMFFSTDCAEISEMPEFHSEPIPHGYWSGKNKELDVSKPDMGKTLRKAALQNGSSATPSRRFVCLGGLKEEAWLNSNW
ncbi:hypothetical protein [Hyphococcus luteus]|uniref:hypothetical protein n=1 Tax=Hyphococcus luteus TaxID=2058213 RepID=UPI0013FD12CB|nr:hypothetical protein [Marinicaulis flavus]